MPYKAAKAIAPGSLAIGTGLAFVALYAGLGIAAMGGLLYSTARPLPQRLQKANPALNGLLVASASGLTVYGLFSAALLSALSVLGRLSKSEIPIQLVGPSFVFVGTSFLVTWLKFCVVTCTRLLKAKNHRSIILTELKIDLPGLGIVTFPLVDEANDGGRPFSDGFLSQLGELTKPDEATPSAKQATLRYGEATLIAGLSLIARNELGEAEVVLRPLADSEPGPVPGFAQALLSVIESSKRVEDQPS